MSDWKYRLYCIAHHTAKKILGQKDLSSNSILKANGLRLGVDLDSAPIAWNTFISNSLIKCGENSGLHYAGYIAENREWCLSSWIWTNAAVVRQLCNENPSEAKRLADCLADKQVDCGGWIVRNDYDKLGKIPVLAPNDSAYIANNAFVTLFEATGEEHYLNIARKCADWIMETAREDYMICTGYNMRDHKWNKSAVIVDVGFTGGLFAKLAELTGEQKYKSFLSHFTNRYIELFYDESVKGFCTSIDENNRRQGGMFGRGQAWALEGLIPAYRILKDNRIKTVINATVNTLVTKQLDNGAWSYNLTIPLMGEDCKAVSVIAKSLMDWYAVNGDERLRSSADKAVKWCVDHTADDGPACGGIFSFCMEGAIVKNLYSSCAFVYACAYALEVEKMLKK